MIGLFKSVQDLHFGGHCSVEYKHTAFHESFSWMKTDTGCLETKKQVAVQRAIKKGKKKKKEVGGRKAFPF